MLSGTALAGRALVGLFLLAPVVLQGCSGSKVTTKSSERAATLSHSYNGVGALYLQCDRASA